MGAKKVPPNGDGTANPKAGSAAKETDPESSGESATAEEPDQDIVEQLGALVRKMRTSGGYKERGERIVAIERPADHGRPAESVRFNYCTYQGHPYFSVRVWREDTEGLGAGRDQGPLHSRGGTGRVGWGAYADDPEARGRTR